VIRMLVCLSVSETTSSGTPWVSMIDATGLVLATRGVRHQDLVALTAISLDAVFGPGISKTSERRSPRGEPVPVTRGALLADRWSLAHDLGFARYGLHSCRSDYRPTGGTRDESAEHIVASDVAEGRQNGGVPRHRRLEARCGRCSL